MVVKFGRGPHITGVAGLRQDDQRGVRHQPGQTLPLFHRHDAVGTGRDGSAGVDRDRFAARNTDREIGRASCRERV